MPQIGEALTVRVMCAEGLEESSWFLCVWTGLLWLPLWFVWVNYVFYPSAGVVMAGKV